MKKGNVFVDEDTRNILQQCRVMDNVVYLPEELPDKLYRSVDKVLNSLGAQWNRSVGGHVFDYDIEGELKKAAESGVYHNWKADTDFYRTPPEVLQCIESFVPEEMNCRTTFTALDPSAGDGAILDFLKEKYPQAKIQAVEINPRHIRTLRQKGYEPVQTDFLQYETEEPVDLVVMNPPFVQDIEHIQHAFALLKLGGTLISVASAGLEFRSGTRYKKWETFCKCKCLEMESLPDKAFRRSNTSIKAVLLSLTCFDTTYRYQYYPNDDIVEINNVEDELYGVTTAVVDVRRFLSGDNMFPCGSGADVQLTQEMRKEIYHAIGMEESERKAG